MKAENVHPLKIKAQTKSSVTSYILSHQTVPENIETSEIFYFITKAPKYGYILVDSSTQVIESFLSHNKKLQ